jgi:Domain of Unknown Function (DUF1080)
MKTCFQTQSTLPTAIFLFAVLAALPTWAATNELTPGGKYFAGDMKRPRPVVVTPGFIADGLQIPPPTDAIVLFDGHDFSQWVREPWKNDPDTSPTPKWKIENGYAEVMPHTGSIFTKEKFGSCQLHLEFATPAKVDPKMTGQNRGNSGVFIFGHGEVQLLDSFENDTYPDGQCAALYHRYPPLVNACRKPGEWQSYDIIYHARVKDVGGRQTAPATVTVFQNGILVQDNTDAGYGPETGALGLQDHLNFVRFRNVWLRKLDGRKD